MSMTDSFGKSVTWSFSCEVAYSVWKQKGALEDILDSLVPYRLFSCFFARNQSV